MKQSDKMLKIAEIENNFAVHFPTVEEYIEFMAETYPELVLVRMWKKYGAETCVYILDQTEAEGLPLTRVIQSRTYMCSLGLNVVNPQFVAGYPVYLLAGFTRGDRVLVNSVGAGLRNAPAIVTGLKAVEAGGQWEYKITVPGYSKDLTFSQAQMEINADHAANRPESDFINPDAGAIRKPAGAKKPIDTDDLHDTFDYDL